jgi:hypothetical protein
MHAPITSLLALVGRKRLVATLVVAVIAMWALRFPPFTGQPSIYLYAEGGSTVYFCGYDELSRDPLEVRYSVDGRQATVVYRGRVVRLKFSHTTLFEDVYRNDSWSLYLDPEARLYGPNGFRTYGCT